MFEEICLFLLKFYISGYKIGYNILLYLFNIYRILVITNFLFRILVICVLSILLITLIRDI